MSTNGFEPPKNVSIIKHKGDPNTATTLDGFKVERTDKFFIPEMAIFMVCAPYDNHFVYEDPSGKPDRWWAMCTCGGPAVYVGANAYKHLAEATKSGYLVVCYTHISTGKHNDGSK